MWIPSLFHLLHFKMCVSVYNSHHLGLQSYLSPVNDDRSVISIVFGHKSKYLDKNLSLTRWRSFRLLHASWGGHEYVYTKLCGSPSESCWYILLMAINVNFMVALEKKSESGISNLIRIHLLRTMNVYAKFYANPYGFLLDKWNFDLLLALNEEKRDQAIRTHPVGTMNAWQSKRWRDISVSTKVKDFPNDHWQNNIAISTAASEVKNGCREKMITK